MKKVAAAIVISTGALVGLPAAAGGGHPGGGHHGGGHHGGGHHGHGAERWTRYGGDADHTFRQGGSEISSDTLADLELAWSFTPGDVVTASPTIVDGALYVGAWDGVFYALDVDDGSVRWTLETDCDNAVVPVPARCLAPGEVAPDRLSGDGGLITTTATYDDGTLYFASGKTLYAVRASDGHVKWKRVVCGNPEEPGCRNDPTDFTRFFSSPLVVGNKIFIGTSVDGAPDQRGGFHVIDKRNGHILHRMEIDVLTDANGEVVKHQGRPVPLNRGCGSVLTTPVYDPGTRSVTFATTDCDYLATEPYHESILNIDADDYDLNWNFRPNEADEACDFDFGASPQIVEIDGQRYLGEGNKNGTYYVLDIASGALVKSINVVYGGYIGGFVGTPAIDADGSTIFGGTAYGELGAPKLCTAPVDNPFCLVDPACGDPFTCERDLACGDPRDTYLQDPSMHAISLVDDPTVLWQNYFHYTYAASTVVNDLVWNGWAGLGFGYSLKAFDKATGDVLLEIVLDGGVASAAVPLGDAIYFGTGNTYDGTGASIQAWRLVSSP